MTDDLRQRIDAAMVQFFGEPCSDTFKNGLVDAAVSALKPELDELLHYRNAITWETSCLSCSRILDNARTREEELEQQLDAARQLISDFVDPDPCHYDHHGYCQAHGWFATEPACPHARAKKILPSEQDEE